MNVKVEHQLTFEEFKEAMDFMTRNFVRKMRARSVSAQVVSGLVVIVGAALVAFFLIDREKSRMARSRVFVPPPTFQDHLHTLLPWILLAGLVAIVFFVLLRRMRSGRYATAWESAPMLHRPRSLQIDDGGLTVADATSETRTNWAHYMRFEETKSLLLLFTSDYSAEYIPKRLFEPGVLEQIRELFRANISAPAHAFPVLPAQSASSRDH